MFESCLEIRDLFSEYMDGVCSPAARRSIRYHLRNCGACRQELETRELIGADLRSLRWPHPSASQELLLEVALSQARHSDIFGSLKVCFENAVRPLLLPASGAVLAGLLCLGLTLDWLAVPPPTAPAASFVTPAAVEALEPISFNAGAEGVWLVTEVNAHGRAVDYQVVSGRPSPQLKSQLDRLVYFSVFRPATRLGEPTSGQVVLSFHRITVHAVEAADHEPSVKPLARVSDLGERLRA